MVYKPKDTGYIEVIRGCMFAGKTEELIRRLNRLRYANQEALVFKPKIDVRSSDEIVSHNGFRLVARDVGDSREARERIFAEQKFPRPVIAFDEAQFFDQGLVSLVQDLAKLSYRVIIAGLDTDFRGEPFGPMPQLLAVADEDTKLHAICVICGEPATMTQRIVNGQPARHSDPVVLVGASDYYEARCRKHHVVLP
ncbi:MAG: thymidine kinase [Firmicutes bacterium]|nr:thymidine kinase [Bacillota bacterium]MCL5040504.1 thymidine kinase [Bacillota bacterium]